MSNLSTLQYAPGCGGVSRDTCGAHRVGAGDVPVHWPPPPWDKPQRCCGTVWRSQRGTGGGGDTTVADPKGGGAPGTRQARLRTGSTRPPHAGDAAVPHREEKLAGGGRRAGGRESRRGEPLLSATPRSPFPPFAPAVVAPSATAPSGEDSSTPSDTGEAGGICARVAFLLGKRVEIVPVLRPCRPPGAAGPAGRPAPPALPFGGDMVLAEGFRTAGPGPPAVPRRSSHRTIECGLQSAPPPAPNHRVEFRPAWMSWSASCSTRPPSGAVSLAANIQESHTRISHCQEQARTHRHVSAARKTEMEVTIVFPCILQHCSTFSSGK